MREEFIRENQAHWKAFLNALFPGGTPEKCVWERPGEITRVLNWIGTDYQVRPGDSEGISNLVHFFYPDSGGNDLSGACLKGATELLRMKSSEHSFTEVHPLRLTFRSVPGKDLGWAYFVLEARPLRPSGVNDDRTGDDLGAVEEEYFELALGNRIARSEYDYLPSEESRDSNHVRRYGSSKFAFWSKGSFYNQADPLQAYNAPHSQVTEEEYYLAICLLAKKCQ